MLFNILSILEAIGWFFFFFLATLWIIVVIVPFLMKKYIYIQLIILAYKGIRVGKRLNSPEVVMIYKDLKKFAWKALLKV